MTESVGAGWTAALVFCLYLLGLWLAYRFGRARLARLESEPPDVRRVRGRRVVLPLLGGVYALAGGASILGVVLLVQAEGGSVNEYVGFVFSSSVSLLVALVLAGAGALATLAFTDTADRAAAIGDAPHHVLLGGRRLPGPLSRALGRLRARPDDDLAAQGGRAEVTRLPVLALRMLRYRVATMLWVLLLLGAAAGDGLVHLGWSHALAAVSLAAAYVAATTVNDVADRDIDRINHTGTPAVRS